MAPALKGRNVLRLNRATVNAAMRFYLEQSVLRDTNVEVEHVGLEGDVFLVTILSPEEKPK